MNNEEIDENKLSTNINTKHIRKTNIPKVRKSSNVNPPKDSSLILKDYNTPNPLKSEKSLFEMEMRKTLQGKQVLNNSNKTLSNYDSTNKIANKR